MTSRSRLHEITKFRAFIDQSVLAAVAAGADTFTSLLSSLPSVYPTELLGSLDRLERNNSIAGEIAQCMRREASIGNGEAPEGRSLLPLPHPLDFEWRFTPDTSRDLLDAAYSLTHPKGKILLLGTPGLAVEALSLPINRQLHFIGEDNIVTRRLVALSRATGSPLSVSLCGSGICRETADAILMDPPWYMDFIRPMLSAAARACREDGVVLISLPPAGTRASALVDNEKVLRLAAQLGFTLLENRELAIFYDTPFFEKNALAAIGVFVPSRWRRGNLMILRKSRGPARLTSPVNCRSREWIEVLIGRMRLFIKSQVAAGGVCGLVPLLAGDVLPTVSRRDRRRRAAQVWTSGNRVFRSDNPALVLEAALVASGAEVGRSVQPTLWGSIAERDAVQRVSYELEALAAKEEAEEWGSPTSATVWGTHWKSSSTRYYSSLQETVSG